MVIVCDMVGSVEELLERILSGNPTNPIYVTRFLQRGREAVEDDSSDISRSYAEGKNS